jgi:hypothetical protein
LDPNDSKRIAIQHDWKFFMSKWEDYLQKKYHKVFKRRWNKKETGGGNGTNPSFQNYCGGDKWLAFV